VHVILSKEGTRMGCVLGGILFDLTAHHRVYQPLVEKYTDLSIRALTDDCVPMAPRPADGDYERVYKRLASYSKDFALLGAPHGLVPNPDKSGLLIPIDAPEPHPSLGFKHTSEGFTVGGGDVGTDEFVKRRASERVEAAIAKIDKIMAIKEELPQMTMRMLTQCGNVLLDYLARVTPPEQLQQAAATFDGAITRSALSIVAPEGMAAAGLSTKRNWRAKMLLSLPTRSGGVGLIPLRAKAPAAFLAGFLASMGDPLFASTRHHLEAEVLGAHSMILQALGIAAIPAGHELASIIPPIASDLLHGRHAHEFLSNHSNSRAVQSKIVQSISARRRMKLLASLTDHLDSRVANKSDVVHIATILTKSQASRVFQSSLFYEANRLESPQFVMWTRWYLGLPLAVNQNATLVQTDCDVPAPRCGANHVAGAPGLIDHRGNHAVACGQACSPRDSMHKTFINTVVKFAKEAFAQIAEDEPKTAELLNNHYTDDQCRLMFPSTSIPAGTRLMASQMTDLIGFVKAATVQDRPHKRALLNDFLTHLAANPHGAKGLRLDVQIVTERNRELLIDVGTTHHTMTSKIRTSFNWAKSRIGVAVAAHEAGLPVPPNTEPSPTVKQRVQDKGCKYEPLISRLEAQHICRKRSRNPTFMACIISNAGEYSADVFRLVETLAMEVKSKHAACPRLGFLTPQKEAASFRMRFKDALSTLVAKGVANILIASGGGLCGASW
jgi:hypothetical protein